MATKNTEVTEAPKNDLAPAPAPVNSSFEIDPEDIDIPRINVTQKMSQSDSPVGSVVYDKTYAIETRNPVGCDPSGSPKRLARGHPVRRRRRSTHRLEQRAS